MLLLPCTECERWKYICYEIVVYVDCAEIRGYCVVATWYNGAEEQAAEADS